jgi:hypothetical protein
MASVRNVSACSMRSGQCSSASVMPASIPLACVSPVLQRTQCKGRKRHVIPETEVTVSRLSRLIEEQVRFGVLGLAEERTWDRESRSWLPTYVYMGSAWKTESMVTPVFATPILTTSWLA